MKPGADIAVETINIVLEGDGTVKTTEQSDWLGKEQPQTLHTAPKIFKETCQINWAQEALHVHNFVRGLSPYPGSSTTLCAIDGEKTEGTVLKIFKTILSDKPVNTEKAGTIMVENRHLYVATANNWIEIAELQLAGKNRMNASDFLNGNKNIENYCVK